MFLFKVPVERLPITVWQLYSVLSDQYSRRCFKNNSRHANVVPTHDALSDEQLNDRL